MLVKSDIGGNIERLATRVATDPAKFETLFSIIEDEVAQGQHTSSTSCTKGLLWLKRCEPRNRQNLFLTKEVFLYEFASVLGFS